VLLDIMQALNWPTDSAEKLHSHLHTLGAASISLAQVHTLLGSHSHSHSHELAHGHEHEHSHLSSPTLTHSLTVLLTTPDNDHHHPSSSQPHQQKQRSHDADLSHVQGAVVDDASPFAFQGTRPRSSLAPLQQFGDADRLPRRNSHMLSDVVITPSSEPSESSGGLAYGVGGRADSIEDGDNDDGNDAAPSPLMLTASPLQDEDVDANLVSRPANPDDPYEKAIQSQSRQRGGSISSAAAAAAETESDSSAAAASAASFSSESIDESSHSHHHHSHSRHHRDASFAFYQQLANVVVPPELVAGMQHAVEVVENQQHGGGIGSGGPSGARRRGCTLT
jgi:hypothetical protein